MFRKVIILLMFLSFIFCGCGKKDVAVDELTQIKSRDKLIVGVRDDAEPFGFRDSHGNLTGYDIELSKIIAKALLGDESKVEFVTVTASDRINKLVSEDVDILIATMSITNHRQQILDFSIPYFVAGQAILVRSSSKAQTLKDFEGNKLIVVFGSTSEKSLRTSVPNIDVIGFKTYPEAYNALKSGKAEGIVADDTILLGFAVKDKSVKLLPKRYSKEPYAVAFRKNPQTQKLQTQVNYVIENLYNSGRLNKMQEKWGIK